jgi:hypothetical protein
LNEVIQRHAARRQVPSGLTNPDGWFHSEPQAGTGGIQLRFGFPRLWRLFDHFPFDLMCWTPTSGIPCCRSQIG